MPTSSIYSSPFHKLENKALLSMLQRSTNNNNTNPRKKSSKSKSSSAGSSGGLFRMFKLLPMLTTGCKMVALLATGGGKPRKNLLTDNATTVTLFGYRKGRLSLSIQEDPHRLPIFVIELPMTTTSFHKEMGGDILRIALESETKTNKKKVLEEYVWAVFCNGRKIGYSIRRSNMSEDEIHVINLLRGVSMSAGVLPSPNNEKETASDGELTYMRARFERVVGSKNSESLYMINPDGSSGQELSIFFLRPH